MIELFLKLGQGSQKNSCSHPGIHISCSFIVVSYYILYGIHCIWYSFIVFVFHIIWYSYYMVFHIHIAFPARTSSLPRLKKKGLRLKMPQDAAGEELSPHHPEVMDVVIELRHQKEDIKKNKKQLDSRKKELDLEEERVDAAIASLEELVGEDGVEQEDIGEDGEEEEELVGEELVGEDSLSEEAERILEALSEEAERIIEEDYASKWFAQDGDASGIPKKYTPCVYFFKASAGGCQNTTCQWSHNEEIFGEEPYASLLKNLSWERNTKRKTTAPPAP